MPNSTLIETTIRPGIRLSSAPGLYLATIATVVLADIHWGYAASQRQAGRLVPLWGDEDITMRLADVLRHYAPQQLVLLGDIVHGTAGTASVESVLRTLSPELRVILVGGNHDARSPLETRVSHAEGGFFFHHGDRACSVPPNHVEVIGHHHPAAVWSDGAGTRVKMPALVESPRRLILPAFSPWAGGVPWNARLEPDERLWMISPRRVFPLINPASG